MGEVLEVTKVLVEPVTKLMEMCGNAIGTLYEPQHMRKMADAEAYRIRQIAQAMTECDNLPIIYDNGDVSLSTADFEDFAKRAIYRERYQALRQQGNIEGVIAVAHQELEGEEDVPDIPVDENWSTRFFNIVKEVSGEEMHYIWGKILAGEIKRPGRFSLRTLEAIRNISSEEAAVFQRVMPVVMFGDNRLMVISDRDMLQRYGICYSDILRLDECGLLLSNGTVSWEPKVTKESKSYMYNSQELIEISGVIDDEVTLILGVYVLSTAGEELFKLLCPKAADGILDSVAKSVYKRFSGRIKMDFYKVMSCDFPDIKYENNPFKTIPERNADIVIIDQ